MRSVLALLLLGLPLAAAGGGFNVSYLVPAYTKCESGTCPATLESTFTFGQALLKSKRSRYIEADKLSFILVIEGVRDAAGNLVTTSADDPADDFIIFIPAAQVYVPGVGVLAASSVPDTAQRFELKKGKAKVSYFTPAAPPGIVSEGGSVLVLDPGRRRLAVIGAQSRGAN